MDNDMTTPEMERRYVPVVSAKIELRAGEDGKARGIGGLAIPVNVRANIGGMFTEEIAPEAVRAVVDEGQDIRLLYNHDSSIVLARTASGTMTVEATKRGLEFDAPELGKTRDDVLEAIERGDVDGVSWAFNVRKEEWDDSGDIPHRTVTEFERVFELSPTAFPAYENATEVSARALDKVKTLAEERALADEIDALTDTDTISHRRRQLQAIQAREAARD